MNETEAKRGTKTEMSRPGRKRWSHGCNISDCPTVTIPSKLMKNPIVFELVNVAYAESIEKMREQIWGRFVYEPLQVQACNRSRAAPKAEMVWS